MIRLLMVAATVLCLGLSEVNAGGGTAGGHTNGGGHYNGTRVVFVNSGYQGFYNQGFYSQGFYNQGFVPAFYSQSLVPLDAGCGYAPTGFIPASYGVQGFYPSGGFAPSGFVIRANRVCY
jgi:hypothetical protein